MSDIDNNNPSKEFEFPSLHDDKEHPESGTPVTSKPPEAGLTGGPANAAPKPPKVSGPSIFSRFGSWYKNNRTIGKILLLGVAGLSIWGISYLRREKEVDPADNPNAVDEVPVNVIEARFGRFQDAISAVGTLKGEVEIELRFEVDGTIQEFNPTEGAKVSRGQIIARLNDRDARLKVQRAQIDLEQNEKLYSLGGISKTKLDESRLNMDVAQSELDKTRIVAKRDGILGEKSADVGEFVTPQRKIASLVTIKSVVVKVGVVEKQVDKVYPGQKLLVTVDAYPGNVFEGVIASISPFITGDSKTFEITAKIPNPDNLLLPGMFARTKLITFEEDDTLSVPNDALIKSTGGFQVYVVSKDNLAEVRDVEVGHVAIESTQIKTGLTPGDIVIVQKPPELKAGSKVKVIEVQK